MTSPALTSLAVPTPILRRGFSLYVLEFMIADETWHYVGRTGDNGHLNASDPFSRLAMHVRTGPGQGKVQNFNKLPHRKSLDPLLVWEAQSYNFHSYGPIFEEETEDDGQRRDRHLAKRLKIAPLENHLNRRMRSAGYSVLNKAGRDHDYDKDVWKGIYEAFSVKFKKLKDLEP
jgi:hypothetical protein